MTEASEALQPAGPRPAPALRTSPAARAAWWLAAWLFAAALLLLPGRSMAQEARSMAQEAPAEGMSSEEESPRRRTPPGTQATGPSPEDDTTPESPSPGDTAQGDVAGWGSARAEIPSRPDGFALREIGPRRWVYPGVARDEVEDLSEDAADAWAKLEADLGVGVDDRVEIRIARGPEEMRELAPATRPPPAYAAGVAYTDLGLVILSLTAPESWSTPDLDALLVHELSHIALRRAVDGRPLPRWFVEGVAIHQSGERSIARAERLYDGTLSRSWIPLEDLDRRFPEQPFEVSLAYAQAADVVEFLRSHDEGNAACFTELIGSLREGEPFDAALEHAYGLSPASLESAWRRALDERLSVIPTLVAGSTFWVVAALLVVWAWRRRRNRAKATLASWEREEAEQHDALARAEAAIDARLQQEAEPSQKILVTDMPPQGREPGVPTVEFDGKNHTLH